MDKRLLLKDCEIVNAYFDILGAPRWVKRVKVKLSNEARDVLVKCEARLDEEDEQTYAYIRTASLEPFLGQPRASADKVDLVVWVHNWSYRDRQGVSIVYICTLDTP